MKEDEQLSQGKPQLAVKIRLMQEGEEYILLLLQEKSIRKLNIKDYNSEQIETIIDRQRINHGIGAVTFVAEHENCIVGFATLNKVIGSISAVFVDPNYVRQGVGKQLLLALEEEATRQNLKSLFVLASLTAVDFYKALEYKILGEHTISKDRIKIPCFYMHKQLAPFTIIDRLYGWLVFMVIFVAFIVAIAGFLSLVILLVS